MKYILYIILILSGVNISAEELKLKNGEIINGRIINETPGKFIVQVDYGKIEINKADLIQEAKNQAIPGDIKKCDKKKPFGFTFKTPSFLIKIFFQIKTLFVSYREESILLIAGLVLLIFAFVSGRVLIPLCIFGLFSWYFYFHLSAADIKDIQQYSQFMHNETYAVKEFCEKENKSLHITSFDLGSAQQVKLMYQRMLERFKLFKLRTSAIKPPKIFKETHNKFKILIAKYTATIEQFIFLIGRMDIKELQALHKETQKYIEEEKLVAEEFDNIATQNGFTIHKTCNCPKHE